MDTAQMEITTRASWMIARSFRLVGRALIAITASGLVLTHLGRGIWYLEAAAYWIPAYVAFAFAGTCCCLAARSRRWALTGVFLLLCAVATIAPCYLGTRDDHGLKPNLRILQANVYEYNKSADALLTLIQDTNPDIVVLQEADSRWKGLLQPLSAQYPFESFAARYPGNATDLGQFWRVESETIKELAEEGLPATLTRIRVAGRSVNLMNVHTAAPFTSKRAVRHREQMLALAKYAAALQEPVIVAGDLNSGVWSSLYRTLVDKAGLVNARQGFGVLGTWPSFFGPLKTGIDQTLVSRDIKAIHCFVGSGIGSDHRPLITDLYVPPLTALRADMTR